MSDYQDPDLDINIDLNMDESKMEKAHKQLSAIETVWNRLSSLPTINFEHKIKMGKITPQSTQKFGIFSADLESWLGVAGRETDSIKKLSYSWDSIYNQELRLLQDREKKEKTLNLLASSVSEKMKSVPASSSGKYHSLFAQGEGGLIKHSKAVAQTAYGLAGLLNVPGNKDRFVVAGLMHDMWKLGPDGNSSFTDPKHGSLAAEALARAGMSAEADLAGPHMGNFLKGQYKNAPKITKFDQRLLNNADWLMSRTYAQDYVKWGENNNIESIDIKGVREEALKRKEARLDKKTGLLIPLNEEQEKATEKAKKFENSWHSAKTSAGQLLDILKTIGGLGLAALTIGIKETAAGSNQINAGLGMFTGTTDAEILDNALRESKVWGKPTGAINKAVAALEAKRGNFNLTGAGDLLPSAFIGQTEALFTSNKPMQQIYGELIDMFTEQLLSTKDQKQKSKLLALVESNLGPDAAYLVNAQARLGTNWAGLGARTSPDNGFLDWSKKVMELNAEIQTSINGIKDTWRGLFTEFMGLFGKPFLDWLDTAFRKLGMDVSKMMNNKAAESMTNSLFNSLTPEEKNKIYTSDTLGMYDKLRKEAKDAYASTPEGKQFIAMRAEYNAMSADTVSDMEAKREAFVKKYNLNVKRNIFGKLGGAEIADTIARLYNAGADAAADAAVGNTDFGGIPFIHSTAVQTAKRYQMFRQNYSKQFPEASRLMSQMPDLMNTKRLADPFDEKMMMIINGLQSGVFTEQEVIPILQQYLRSVDPATSKDKTSMTGAAQINMNFNLPDGSNVEAVRMGILDASKDLPKVINDAYLSMYAGAYG